MNSGLHLHAKRARRHGQQLAISRVLHDSRVMVSIGSPKSHWLRATDTCVRQMCSGGRQARSQPQENKGKEESVQQLNVAINRCADEAELQKLMQSKMGHFDSINVSTAFLKLSKLRRGGGRAPFHGNSGGDTAVILLASRAKLLEREFESHTISNILGALTKLTRRMRDDDDALRLCYELVSALCRRAVGVKDTFTASHIANTLWALSKLGPKPGAPRAVDQLASRGCEIQSTFNAQVSFAICCAACGNAVRHAVLKQQLSLPGYSSVGPSSGVDGRREGKEREPAAHCNAEKVASSFPPPLSPCATRDAHLSSKFLCGRRYFLWKPRQI